MFWVVGVSYHRLLSQGYQPSADSGCDLRIRDFGQPTKVNIFALRAVVAQSQCFCFQICVEHKSSRRGLEWCTARKMYSSFRMAPPRAEKFAGKISRFWAHKPVMKNFVPLSTKSGKLNEFRKASQFCLSQESVVFDVFSTVVLVRTRKQSRGRPVTTLSLNLSGRAPSTFR